MCGFGPLANLYTLAPSRFYLNNAVPYSFSVPLARSSPCVAPVTHTVTSHVRCSSVSRLVSLRPPKLYGSLRGLIIHVVAGGIVGASAVNFVLRLSFCPSQIVSGVAGKCCL